MKKLRSHGVLLGQTQSGKTTIGLKYLAAQKDGLKLFINTKREQKWTKYFKYMIKTPEDLEHVYSEYSSYTSDLFLIEPDVTDGGSIDQIGELLDVILKFHQDNPQKFKTYIFIDEIQVYQSKFSRPKSFVRLWTMGLGLGIRAVAVAQRPQLINNDILYNSETWLLCHLTEADLEYLDEKGIIQYAQDKHVYNSPYDAFLQDNKKTGLKRLKTT